MSEIKRCFRALGFAAIPTNPMDVIARADEMLQMHKDSTATDRLARQTIKENRDMCLEAMEEELE